MFNQKIIINILSMDNFDEMKILMDINSTVNYQRNFSQNKKKTHLEFSSCQFWNMASCSYFFFH